MKLSFLGAGKMARAIISGVLAKGLAVPGNLLASHRRAEGRDALAAEFGIGVTADNTALAAFAPVIILSVKPQDMPAVLESDPAAWRGKLLISVAAGLSLARLQTSAGAGGGDAPRIIRVMPNTPSLVGQGAAAYAKGPGATDADAALVERVFGAVGRVHAVKENLLDAVTGVSGSGPAYIYTVIESMADGGVLMGLPRDLALALAAQTVLGAAQMVLTTGQHPAALRDAVASPGGTTIAAIEQLETRGLRPALIAAVRAATEKAREMGK